MKKPAFIHTIYLLSLAAGAVGFFLLFMGVVGNPQTISLNLAFLKVAHHTLPAIYTLGQVVLASGAILALVAWIVALVQTARNRQWAWFVCLLLFSFLALLVYIFVEPGTFAPQRNYARAS